MAIRPNAHFIDIWRLLADDKGGYADRLDADGEPEGKTVRVRAGDGIHLQRGGRPAVEAHVRAFVHRSCPGSSAGPHRRTWRWQARRPVTPAS